MFFEVLLYGSLAVFTLGSAYKVFNWFSRSLRQGSPKTPRRLADALKGVMGAFFSLRILPLLRAFVMDVLFQKRILKEDRLRWAMHMLIFWGFMLLLLMHAMEKWISMSIFKEYASTANPFLFLRDLFGLMVLTGACIALYRRFIIKVPRLKTRAPDIYAILILMVVILSGITLKGAKIISHKDFSQMVKDYADTDDPSSIKALESYWVMEMGLWAPDAKPPFPAEILKRGLDIHETSCENCHANPRWAFAGYSASVVMRPAAKGLDKAGAAQILWAVHIFACFLGLAYLPFSKMFHIIATPVSLLANAAMDPEKADPSNLCTRRVMELDACTQCGTCSLMCSSAPASSARGNPFVLPSEKMRILRELVRGKGLSSEALEALREGVYLCTSCERCTVVCPSGIDLKALWRDMREEMPRIVEKGEPLLLSPFAFAGEVSATGGFSAEKALEAAWRSVIDKWEPPRLEGRVLELPRERGRGATLTRAAETFSACFGCRNCTNVCPVVGAYEAPEKTLGLLPHQIMACLGMGLPDLAFGSAMLWNCLTCYQCQEHCPQMVEVADILYEVKNIAIRSDGAAQTGGSDSMASP